jgi:hypothetical protein
MKYTLTIFYSLFSFFSFSCECPPLASINKTSVDPYNVIFYGKVDSIAPCGTGGLATAYFSIKELYKGDVPANIKVDFDCSTECMMSITKGDEWLIYANSKQYGSVRVEFCSHSRKFFSKQEEDIYFLSSQRTFNDEIKLLNKLLGVHTPVSTEGRNDNTDLQHKNDQPSGMNKIWLLAVSFVVMMIVLVVSQKMKK